MLNYQRIAQASLMGPGGMPLSMYNSAAYAEGLPAAAYMPGVGPEQFHYVSLKLKYLQFFFVSLTLHHRIAYNEFLRMSS